jgi:hypothetical protein
MPSLCIYAGEPVGESVIESSLQNYRKLETREIGDEPKEFLDEVSHFEIKRNGDFHFIYQWDDSVPYEFRNDGMNYFIKTHYCDVRIIKTDKLYFLIDNKDQKTHPVAVKLSTIIYKSSKKILPVRLSSQLIKNIESLDSINVTGARFDGINARDKHISITGLLSRKLQNGSRDYSDMHRTYGDKPQSRTKFLSASTNVMVGINKTQSRVTLMKVGDLIPSLDDVESYIKEIILPMIASNSVI